MTNDAAANNSPYDTNCLLEATPILHSHHSWCAIPLAQHTHRQPSSQHLLHPSLLLLLL